MPIHLAHYRHQGETRWGLVRSEQITPLEGRYSSTAALIAGGKPDWRAAAQRPAALPLSEVELLSPVTPPCRVLCQGANYRQHMIESGLDPDQKNFNIFFTKSDAAVTGPQATVQRPAHVRLLDYEVELGLVFKSSVTDSVAVTRDTLHEHVFGLVIGNDLSARDVQLPQLQWLKGKSYRGFCPLGPVLCVLEPRDFAYLDALNLTLLVNGHVRQHDSTANLVFKPHETLTELSTFSNWSPGDVLLTGTPAGCALRAPPAIIQKIGALLPEEKKWAAFKKGQTKRTQYLQPGDIVTAVIHSADRAIDLGEQRITISG